MKFSVVSYAFWIATAIGQVGLLLRWRHLPRPLTIYLGGEIALTMIGIPISILLPERFPAVWQFASFSDDILSTFLVIAAWSVARERSRLKYRSPLIVLGAAVLSFAVASLVTASPLRELEGHPGQIAYTMAHIWWAWLNVFFGLLPLFCVIAGSALNRRAVLVMLGVGAYLAVHAGVVDYLIDTRFLHHLSAGVVSTCAYFFSLVLWFSSAKDSSPIETSHA